MLQWSIWHQEALLAPVVRPKWKFGLFEKLFERFCIEFKWTFFICTLQIEEVLSLWITMSTFFRKKSYYTTCCSLTDFQIKDYRKWFVWTFMCLSKHALNSMNETRQLKHQCWQSNPLQSTNSHNVRKASGQTRPGRPKSARKASCQILIYCGPGWRLVQ